MVKKLLLPQEIETFYVIPTLRKHLALALKEKGMKQKDIAELMMINTAAISQYSSHKRGDQVHFDARTLEEIKTSASLIKDRLTYLRETQRLLQVLRNSCVLCDIHKQFSEVPEGCEPKHTGCDQLVTLRT